MAADRGDIRAETLTTEYVCWWQETSPPACLNVEGCTDSQHNLSHPALNDRNARNHRGQLRQAMNCQHGGVHSSLMAWNSQQATGWDSLR